MVQNRKHTRRRGRVSSNSRNIPTTLVDSAGSIGTLKEIPSNDKGRVRQLIAEEAGWLNNPSFQDFKKRPLDISLVLFVNKMRAIRQDVDNIAKVLLDALKKRPEDPTDPYLFEDDSQIVRLLVWKCERDSVEGFDTDGFVLSFRKHDPEKQMILK